MLVVSAVVHFRLFLFSARIASRFYIFQLNIYRADSYGFLLMKNNQLQPQKGAVTGDCLFSQQTHIPR